MKNGIILAVALTVLTARMGVNTFNGHKETWYNLNMDKVVSNADEAGLCGWYWEREDGCKMYGPFIIVAANLEKHPYGSIVETSLGWGIVLDTGDFAKENDEQYDIAVTW